MPLNQISSSMKFPKNITKTHSKLFHFIKAQYIDFFWIVIFSTLLFFVVDRYLMERIVGWDHFWMDAQFLGRIHVLKEALLEGNLPFITSTYDFGHYWYGDPSHHISGLFPGHWLILFVSPTIVWSIRLIFLFILGCFGCYLFIKRYTESRIYSLAVAFYYVFFPAAWTMRYGSAMDSWIYFMPLFLEIIVRYYNNEKKSIAMFVGLSFIATTLSGTIVNIINSILVISCFSFFVYWFDQKKILSSIFFSFKLAALYLLSGAFYIIPLAFISFQVSEFRGYFCEYLGVCPTGLWTTMSILDYLKHSVLESFFSRNNIEISFYTPLFLNIAGIISLLFSKIFEFSVSVSRLIRGLFCIIVILFVLPFFVMYTPINKLFLFRSHYLIIPYLWLLLSSIGFYFLFHKIQIFFEKICRNFCILKLNSTTWKMGIIICFTLSVFYLFGTYFYRSLFSNNFFEMIVSELLVLFLYFFSASYHNEKRKLLTPLLIMVIGLFAALGQRYYLEMFYGGSELKRSDSCLKLDSNNISDKLKKHLAHYDKDYRLMFTASNWEDRGRNWQLIAQTELHPLNGLKVLFTWNYGSHPYLLLLRSAFSNGNVRRVSDFPPNNEQIIPAINLLRLMGVKYIVSAHASLQNIRNNIQHTSSFYYKTQCKDLTGFCTGAKNAEDEGLSGNFYLYEIQDPLKIAFFSHSYEVQTRSRIYNAIRHNAIMSPEKVLLEEDPRITPFVSSSEERSRVTILKENDSQIDILTESETEKMLVLSYTYWPFWQAYIDGKNTKIYRAYGGFMSIKVPSGTHSICFKYRPWDFYLGIFISFLTLIIAFVGVRHRPFSLKLPRRFE